MWDSVARQLEAVLQRPVSIEQAESVSGGCIHQAARLITPNGESFFIKINDWAQLPAFEAEVDGLNALRKAEAIRVPQPLGWGIAAGKAFLVLEHIEMVSRGRDSELGQQLARLHQHTNQRFGWHVDNFIGQTPQKNTWSADWIVFLREQRLRFQIDRAISNGIRLRHADALLDQLEYFFNGYQPVPSLLHGDLWAGNAAFDTDGNPVIFDPAVYYGDREADLALTELFGGFGQAFYSGYKHIWPLDPGYTTRKTLYKLYHVLNHFNLFGGGYARQGQSMVDDLLRQIP